MNNIIMSIDPRIWGPKAWFIMYSVALTYPHKPSLEDKINTKTFYVTIGKVLPCEKCRLNFSVHLEKFPITNDTLDNRRSLVDWLININNEVNKLTKGPIVTYNDIVNKYSVEFNPENLNKNKQDKLVPHTHQVNIKFYLLVTIPLISTIIVLLLFLHNNKKENKLVNLIN